MHFQKNFIGLLPLIRSLKVDCKEKAHLPKYQFIVRTALIALRFHIPNADPDVIAVAFAGYASVLRMSAEHLRFDEYMTHLCWITLKTDLEAAVQLLTAENTAVPVRQWLRSVTDSLRAANARDGTADDTALKTTFVQLTSVLLIYLRVEEAHPIHGGDGRTVDSLVETLELLDLCMNIKRFDDPMYGKCFGLLKSFLLGLGTTLDFSRMCTLLEKDFT